MTHLSKRCCTVISFSPFLTQEKKPFGVLTPPLTRSSVTTHYIEQKKKKRDRYLSRYSFFFSFFFFWAGDSHLRRLTNLNAVALFQVSITSTSNLTQIKMRISTYSYENVKDRSFQKREKQRETSDNIDIGAPCSRMPRECHFLQEYTIKLPSGKEQRSQ